MYDPSMDDKSSLSSFHQGLRKGTTMNYVSYESIIYL